MSAPGTTHPTNPEPFAGTEAGALARALAHLLARDDDRPARWAAPAFAEAVELARAERHADGWGHGAGLETAAPAVFEAAVARLARDPRSVALAIRHLEASDARRLPPWSELIRRRRPPTVTNLDVAIWFG